MFMWPHIDLATVRQTKVGVSQVTQMSLVSWNVACHSFFIQPVVELFFAKREGIYRQRQTIIGLVKISKQMGTHHLSLGKLLVMKLYTKISTLQWLVYLNKNLE